jgi:methionyl-tRNA formyltransferase
VIESTDTTPSLTDKLITLSYEMLQSTLDSYTEGTITPYKQEGEATYTRKLEKADGTIDWQKPAMQLEREIRAYAEWPKSRTSFNDIDCVILKATTLDTQGVPGELYVHEKELAVHCGEGSLLVHELKPAGKKTMTSQAFLAGYRKRINL